MKIWALSITVDEPITPLQLRPKSNKFVWSSRQGKEWDKKCVSAAEPLVAVQLSLVCRLMYQEVAATHVSIASAFCPLLDHLINISVAILSGQSFSFRVTRCRSYLPRCHHRASQKYYQLDHLHVAGC